MALTTFAFDASHSHIAFTVRHMVFAKVRGEFTGWKGTVQIDDQNLAASRVEVTIDAASISTHEEKRDGHLKSADFFDVENHKELTFRATGVEGSGKGFKLKGDLTIRGTTKPVVLDVEELGRGKDPWGNERVGYGATAKIDRREFGLNFNQVLETGGVLVGDTVDIAIDVELIKQAG